MIEIIEICTLFSSTTDKERDLLLNNSSALDTLLHDGGTVLAGHHVEAGPEQDRGGVVRAHEAVADDGPVVDELLAEQTLLDPWRTS